MKRKVIFVFIISLIIFSCKRQFGDFYDPPTGQKGQIYLQLAANPSLSTFVSAIDKVPGLKQELSSSGLFTVMAPDNHAFVQFFASHPSYGSVDGIQADTLAALVKFHIMKWMLLQDHFLNPGAIGTTTLPDFSTFKYLTRATTKYNEKLTATRELPIYYDNKMLQVYTPNFFTYFSVTPTDYSNVYGAGTVLNEETKINVMGAQVKELNITGGNGVYYVIDKVLSPPMNVAQELDNNAEYSEYNQLLKKRFVTYTYNAAGTLAQGNNGDINNDGLVDSMWTRNYSTDVNFDKENPMMPDNKTKLSLSVFIPSKSAFTQYMNTKLLPNFENNIDSIPSHTLKLLYQGHITNEMNWPSRIDAGYVASTLGDKPIAVTRSNIISVKMASNGLFYCTDNVAEPKAFTAVTGPAFFSKKYWYFAEMIVQSGGLGVLTSSGLKYTIFAPTDIAFMKRTIYWIKTPVSGAAAGFYRVDPATLVQTAVSSTEIATIVNSHVVLNNELVVGSIPDGFYPSPNTSFIVVQNGKVFGSERDTIPNIIESNIKMSNGYFNGIDKLMMAPQQSIYAMINGTNATAVPPVTPEYLKFKELCSAAGILATDFGTITAAAANRKFTLFVPSNESIIAAQNLYPAAGSLPQTGAQGSTTITTAMKTQLLAYIKGFFVPDKQICTDGKILGPFNTSNLNITASTPGNDVFYQLTISLPMLTVKNSKGTSALVDLSQPLIYPQNRLCTDGVVHIINNAFTSQY